MGRAAVSVRAINVPGHRHHRPCRTVVTVLVDLIRTVVAALRDLCPTGLDQRAQRVGNTAVTSICGVLVGQRRAHRAVTHPVHQLPRSRARTHGQPVSRVSDIVEVEPGGESGQHNHRWPVRAAAEVPTAEHRALLPKNQPLHTHPTQRRVFR
jgi:hypothetical protein